MLKNISHKNGQVTVNYMKEQTKGLQHNLNNREMRYITTAYMFRGLKDRKRLIQN